ncbi:MAG: SET domain-containing protein-lysine N-methyltransferase [Limisphaerales bacterium]
MQTKVPHYGVYARIGRSKLHGVGIIAIRSIRKGTYIFSPDDDKLRWVKVSEIRCLPKEIRKLYEDFCIRKGARYLCPITFNKLTPAWYLNESRSPNVAADRDYRFYALRHIKKGEELTVDYSTYSEPVR